MMRGGNVVEAHGGYLCRYEDVDVGWLASLAKAAIEEDGQSADDVGLLVTLLPGHKVVRFAFDAAHTYGRAGARWYLVHHAFAKRLSEHLNLTVHAYVFDPEDLEQVISFGNGRRVGGECLRYDEVELDDDDDQAFEKVKRKWPLGHLSKVLGVEREELIRVPRNPSVLVELNHAAAPGPLWQLLAQWESEERVS